MRAMKDSGIDWIGKIPDRWTTKRIKFVLNERNVKNSPIITTNLLSLTQTQGIVPYSEKVETGGNKAKENFEDYIVTFPGDIVVNSMNLLTGAVGLSMYHGCISPAYYVFYKSKREYDERYFEYIFETKVFQNSMLKYGNGILIKLSGLGNYYTVRMRVPKDTFNNIVIPVPNANEQKIIADFLDSKCAEIDALSTDIQSEIDTIEAYKRSIITEAVTKGLKKNAPMKESGIKWIGKMPANWDIVRGKFILKYLQKPVKEDDGVITCFRDGEVTLRSNRREEGFTMSDKEIGYQGIDVGDLVVHGMDGFAGSIGISDSRGKASPVLNVLDTDENKKYIMYYLRSMAYSDVFLALATGIRVRSCDLRWNKLAELFYPVPPKHEQNRIVQYIDDTLHQADEIIAQKKEQLSVLADYKKSVIYECVTGKKEVPAV